MFSTGAYFKIWNVSNKGNYSEVECSTQKKDKQTGNYATDFSSKFVRFVGNAHKKSPQPNERIKVTSCGVENVYQKDGKNQYMKNPTYLVFDFERDGVAPSNYMPSGYAMPDFNSNIPNFEEIGGDDASLPF